MAVIIIWQLQRFMSDAESPDMDGKLQVYRLEKRKGEVDDANIIAGKRVRPQDPAPIVSAAPRTVAPRRVSPKKAAPSPPVPAADDDGVFRHMLRADLQPGDLVLVKGCDFTALAKAGVAPDAVCTAEVLSSTAVGARCKVAGVSDMLLLPPGHQAASLCVRPERVRRFVFVSN